MGPVGTFFFGLAALLLFLALVERIAARRKREQVLGDLETARERGTNRPLGQHPIINEIQCVGCGLCIKACPEEQVLDLVDGVAQVVHGSRCIGHGRCEEVCPVAGLTVGLGDVTGREDIPLVNEHHESNVPGLYVVGELSGIALIRHAISHGTAAVQQAAQRRKQLPVGKGEDLYELVIVGCGPAGLAASLEAHRLGLRTVTLEQDQIGGTIRHYPRQKLVMTQPVALPLAGALTKTEYRKEELEELFQTIISQYDFPVLTGARVGSILPQPHGFTVESTAGNYQARQVILALGRRGTPRKLGVPGEDQAKVAYRLVDAALYQHKHILVVGGGDSAIEAALALAAQPGNEVTLSYRKANFFRIKPRNEQHVMEAHDEERLTLVFDSQVESIDVDTAVLNCKQDQQTVPMTLANDFVFVFAGGLPPYPLLREVGVKFGSDLVEKPAEDPRPPQADSAVGERPKVLAP